MIRALKGLFSFVSYYSGFWRLVFWLCRLVEKKPVLAVFTFHRITEGEPDPKFLQGYERGQPLSLYRRQIEVLSRYFRIVDLDRFYGIVTGEVSPRGWRPIALLTYDDADSDHGRLAFALLQEKGLPGLSFVPTGFIGTSRYFYHCRLTNICNKLTENDFQDILKTDIPDDVKSVLVDYEEDFDSHRYEIRRRLIRPFAAMTPRARDNLIADWEGYFGGVYDLGISCMTWSDVLALPKKNITVGSHTINHNRLALLREDEIVEEIKGSKVELERRLGRPVHSISYPEGSYTEFAVQTVKEAGYKIAFSTVDSLVEYPIRDSHLFVIPRIGSGAGSNHRICYAFGTKALKRLIRVVRGGLGTGKGSPEPREETGG